MDRPPTRSGSNAGETGGRVEAATAGGDSTPAKASAKPSGNIFSDSDDLLDGLGIDEGKGRGGQRAEVIQRAKPGG